MTQQPFALFIRGPQKTIFQIAEILGFETDMEALAISIFEDEPDGNIYHIQALYEARQDADTALTNLNLDPKLEGFVTQLPDEDWGP